MRQFDLEPALCRGRSFPENLQDETGSVDDFAFERFLKIALLDCAERAVNDNQFRLVKRASGLDRLDLTDTKKRVWTHCADRNDRGMGRHQTNGKREPLCLGEAALRIKIVFL